jgi:hypothetical protein
MKCVWVFLYICLRCNKYFFHGTFISFLDINILNQSNRCKIKGEFVQSMMNIKNIMTKPNMRKHEEKIILKRTPT